MTPNTPQRRHDAAILATIALALLTAAHTAHAESIWIEGEDATRKQVSHHGWYDGVDKSGMSNNEWLSHYGNNPGTAEYDFDAPAPGRYTFWWRGNPLLAAVSWSINGGPLTPMSFADKRGEYMISQRPDHRNLAWVKVGPVDLRQGPNTLTLRFHSDTSNHGGVDAMVFTNDGFVPSGATRPSAAADTPAAPDAWFPVVFDDDPFSPDSVIDQSDEIPAPAGQYGFLNRDGADLRFENADQPIRFWGAGANAHGSQLTRDQQTQRIRYLRKHGINMVRQHPILEDIGPMRNGRFNAQRLDDYDFYFAELKRHGIYTTWSVFYGLNIYPEDGYDPALYNELPDRAGGKNTYGIVNVERDLQDIQLRYLRALLEHVNPYTGLRYADDPALAVLETHNEDTVFFHNPLNILAAGEDWPLHSRRLRQRFFQWVRQKYGSQAAVQRAWGGLRPNDNWARGELELMAAFHLGPDGPLFEFAGQTARAGDYIAFLTEMQRGFYERRESEVRSLGFKGVTVTTAWRSGGPAADPANLYADTAADMIDRHAYFGGGAGGHNIAAGNVNNGSHLNQPGQGLLAMGLYQVEDRPFSTTEWTQLPPNRQKLEAAPLIAFYGMGLQGWDASYHFTSSRPRLGDGWPNLNSYVTDTPHYIGQFPALAYAIRHAHIAEADIAAARRITTADLFTGTDPLGQAFDGYDVKQLAEGASTPPETLAIGRVTVAFNDARPSQITDLENYWDPEAKIIVSSTGQLVWDYATGLVTLQGPRTHAILGNAGGRTIDLPGVTAAVRTPFVSIIFTPLDDLPLAESRNILITAMARDIQTGARYSEDGSQLLEIGAPPLLMEPVQADIRIEGTRPTTVRPLDLYGVPRDTTIPTTADGTFTIDGTHRTYYYQVTR